MHVGGLGVRGDDRVELLVREGVNIVKMPGIILGYDRRRRYQGENEVDEIIDEHVAYDILYIIAG